MRVSRMVAPGPSIHDTSLVRLLRQPRADWSSGCALLNGFHPDHHQPIGAGPLMLTIASYLDWAKTGNRVAALEALVDLGESAIPRLVEAYRAEKEPALRALIVEAVWQIRSHASLAFLGEALQDPSPEVWRQALDGLVTLATPESLQTLEGARDTASGANEDFRAWVEGAIEDVSGRIDE
jgi:HEAT repeats